jgi:hypothetical protein
VIHLLAVVFLVQQKWLQYHKLAQVCGLSTSVFRKSRGKSIITRGNSLKDQAVEMIMKDGFATVATVVGQKTKAVKIELFHKKKSAQTL